MTFCFSPFQLRATIIKLYINCISSKEYLKCRIFMSNPFSLVLKPKGIKFYFLVNLHLIKWFDSPQLKK